MLEAQSNPAVLMGTYGCSACHTFNGNDGGIIGPNLDRDALVARLEERLNSQSYVESLRKVDELEIEPFVSYSAARREVENSEGTEKIRTWLYYRILEPTFDNPNAGMPRLGLSNQQARTIADFLAGITDDIEESSNGRGPFSKITDAANWMSDLVQDQLPIPNQDNAKKFLAAFFAVGVLFGVLGTASLVWVFVLRRRRRDDRML